ncbi:DDE-type integrase/transposase/recombinase [Comamonas testosteroni]|uniref:DDE-type integrase/transposase/recombinase n=1 Tax=Comamonas testosteroni TaxID=285 RepID=UPI00389A6146
MAAVMGLAGRRAVGWSMSETIDATLVCTALKSPGWLRESGKGLVVHTDCGSQYAGERYRELAVELGVSMSMSRKASAWDNSPMECFFKRSSASIRYPTTRGLYIVDWIEGWFNR